MLKFCFLPALLLLALQPSDWSYGPVAASAFVQANPFASWGGNSGKKQSYVKPSSGVTKSIRMSVDVDSFASESGTFHGTGSVRDANGNYLAEIEDMEGALGKDDESSPQQHHIQPKLTKVRIHTFVDSRTNLTWTALNTSKRKFQAYLEYQNISGFSKHPPFRYSIPPRIFSETISLTDQSAHEHLVSSHDIEMRRKWRELWKAGQLLTDRTELLAVYQSDRHGAEAALSLSQDSAQHKRKRGGFTDLLHLYTDRLLAILRDEQQGGRLDKMATLKHPSAASQPVEGVTSLPTHIRQSNPERNCSNVDSDRALLVGWLEQNYGVYETEMLKPRRFRSLPVKAQIELLNHFLTWFREIFPYFYDRCDSCGASRRDDLASQDAIAPANPVAEDDDDDDDNGTFLGYIYPSELELRGKASRTELYQCHKCGSFTRFPRFNSAFYIIRSRRGRCGEYSLLLYRFLRALNHDVRWVVDWADHVWAEILISDSSTHKWIHLDPCEAAVNMPLLYQDWGKKQTYIMALFAPLDLSAKLEDSSAGFCSVETPLIEDVTQKYTSEDWTSICRRREETQEEVTAAIARAEERLFHQLLLHRGNC